ncbi:hypothetical protein MNBD_UNCLBAC01-2083 [hydrothermal vent metagenome]|uniref:Pyridoxamine 5'-phosphate oxidase N-terminal domain-containing protein n=1 Tax=hydrothermal vent metagenome TaxID=652676 RepID=A0A3B1DZH6_9ZZZZ
MAKFYDELNEGLINFIKKQKIFFTATSAQEGRINLSPKGMDTFRCLNNKNVAYLNLTGSANETAAHVLADGRMTIMLCSFDTAPLILRLYGKARTVHQYDKEWEKYFSYFMDIPGKRQIVVLDIESVQISCGYSIPFYEFKGDRNQLIEWAEKKGEQGVRKYWEENNQISIDGLETKILGV